MTKESALKEVEKVVNFHILTLTPENYEDFLASLIGFLQARENAFDIAKAAIAELNIQKNEEK